MRLNTSKEEPSKTEFDDFLLNMSLNQQDFFKTSDRKPPLKNIEGVSVRAFDFNPAVVEAKLSLLPEGHEVKSANNNLQITESDREYRSNGMVEPLERMPSINLSKISAKPEYSSDRESKGSKSNHNSNNSNDQGAAPKLDANLSLSFESTPVAQPEQKFVGQTKKPMETIEEQKSAVEDNSFDQQSQLEDEFHFFEKKFARAGPDSSHLKSQERSQGPVAVGREAKEVDSRNQEEEDDDFAGKYFGGISKAAADHTLNVPVDLKGFNSQNDRQSSYRSKYSSQHMTENPDFATANFNSKFSFNPEHNHRHNASLHHDQEPDESQEESFRQGQLFDPDELKQVKRSEQLLGFNREDLSSHKLEETPQLSNFTHSQKKHEIKGNFHTSDDEDIESDRLIVKNIFKDYTSRELEDLHQDHYDQLCTSREESQAKVNEEEEEFELPIDFSRNTSQRQRQSQFENGSKKHSVSESDSITLEVNYDRDSYLFEEKTSNLFPKKSPSTSIDRPSRNYSYTKDQFLPQEQPEAPFRKKSAVGLETGQSISRGPSRQQSFHNSSFQRAADEHEESRVLMDLQPQRSSTSYQLERSYARSDALKNSFSHSTSILEETSKATDRNRSLQSHVPANLPASDGRLINLSMQVGHSGKLL